MANELEEFHQEFFQGVHGLADAGGQYAEDAFFESFCEQLVDAGELDTADRVQYLPPQGVRVDGYGGDPAGAEGVLSLIIADFNQSAEPGTLTATDMEAIFRRLYNFMEKSLNPAFRESLEETSSAFGLADLIATRWQSVVKVRLFLISNRILSARVDGREAVEFQGIPVAYSVWDLERLYHYAASGRAREDMEIDLKKDFGGGVAALPAHLDQASYAAYLIVVPALQLAAIYERWGARLLEQNVRVFLQARGNINKGIRNTIENDPGMFFAYNNGITATAESVETEMSERGLLLTRFKNLQIVNGGQTTASIHAASRKKDIDLGGVFVQMKLSIIEPSQTINIVPKISEYANSQNRVNAADFFSNHPFHLRIEEFSRRIFAPSPDGAFRQSKWFYERARGQYQDARTLLTPAQKRKFDLEYPKSQVFSKTDLAKYVNLWRGHPDIVSKGTQKNFAHFALATGREWSKHPDEFNETFYRQAIARAILFRQTEKLVTQQPWYEGGYRANVVAYAIAKLAHDTGQLGRSVNFETIWRRQGITESLEQALKVVAEAAHEVIVNPVAGIRNVTEWAKQQACWNLVSALKIAWPEAWLSELITGEEQDEICKSALKVQKMDNGIEAQAIVVKAGGNLWRNLKDWGVEKSLLTSSEAGILDAAASVSKRLPTEKQCLKTCEILKKLHAEGCRIGVGIA